MIRDYADHAANERTFLAWLRTGIAVVAFGFVIEKFNLFVLAMADGTSLDAAARAHLGKRGRLASAPATPLSSSGFSSSWARPSASSVPGDCWMTRRCTRPVSSLTWLLVSCWRSSSLR